MKFCFVGTSHAPSILKEAATLKGLDVTEDIRAAHLVFVSEDTKTDEHGNRDLDEIRNLVLGTQHLTPKPLVLSSQVPPGFTRQFKGPIYHMAETLRMKDALDRALNPEQIILGCRDPREELPVALEVYCGAFDCPTLKMSYEEAEFSKIAINLFLAAQVDTTNRLAAAAAKVGADWRFVAKVLQHDRRIGPFAYLTPGRWQDSRHLLRDARWLEQQ